MPQTSRHKIFISYHHVMDDEYKRNFVQMMGDEIVDKSVKDGDIDDRLPIDTTRREIRDKYIAEATVTVVLIGRCTWRRKHVDWEIHSSLRDTGNNPRCGLLGILLPNHPDYGTGKYNPRLIPPRLADNCGDNDPYALIYDWSTRTASVRRWIHKAFERKKGTPPNNGRLQFRNNRSGDCLAGWKS